MGSQPSDHLVGRKDEGILAHDFHEELLVRVAGKQLRVEGPCPRPAQYGKRPAVEETVRTIPKSYSSGCDSQLQHIEGLHLASWAASRFEDGENKTRGAIIRWCPRIMVH